jgi:Protein of unknown function (DUF2934)
MPPNEKPVKSQLTISAYRKRASSFGAQMEHTLEHRIRQRAYEIWNADGREDGKADEHWLAAEREVLSSLNGRPPAPKASAQRKSDKRRQRIPSIPQKHNVCLGP